MILSQLENMKNITITKKKHITKYQKHKKYQKHQKIQKYWKYRLGVREAGENHELSESEHTQNPYNTDRQPLLLLLKVKTSNL